MLKRNLLAAVTLISMTSCATIVSPTQQCIAFNSTPSGAQVWVDDMPVGKTPTQVALACWEEHIVKIEHEGYEPFVGKLSRGVNGWVFGNIVFGGVFGAVVDYASGAMYKLKPNEIHACLAEMNQGHEVLTLAEIEASDECFFFVTSNPNPNWEKLELASA